MSDDVQRNEQPDAAHPTGGVPVATMTDPHMQPYARHPARAEAVTGLLLLVGVLGFAAYGAVYFVNGSTQWQAVSLGIGFIAFGIGLTAWGKYLLPQGPFVEERHPLAASQAERDALGAAIVDRGRLVFRRRGFLGGLLGLGGAVMGVVLAFPAIRSLGPLPKKTFDHTHWRRGVRLVDIDGNPVHYTDLETGGVLTVFPEGHVGDAMDQTLLIRPGGPLPGQTQAAPIVTAPGRETWGPQGYLAFSKVCTHAGCPVGLYQKATSQLLCPCHQSLFDVGAGKPAVPVFGPAPRPLPQLPLMVDADGFLAAQSDYHEPVGPGFWERS